jgi:transcriptional regulator with XRE-family HTH domain
LTTGNDFTSVLSDPPTVANQQKFFHELGKRVRGLRIECGYSQEDMISHGFSARHWQQIETGRPITVSTLLRICEVFNTSVERLVHGLDGGIYKNKRRHFQP